MIKPCPFCKGSSSIIIHESKYFKVWCFKCHARTQGYSTRLKAIRAWNKRPREKELLSALKYSKINVLKMDAAHDTDVMKIIEVVKKYEGEK
jgi:Lar family restriction alleviation protein